MANGTSGRLDYLIQGQDKAVERGFQADQRRQDRELQERMQKRALRQNAIFGGINAALGVGQLGLGVANYLQRGEQFDRQASFQEAQAGQRQENLEVGELLSGAATATSIASNVMATKRQKDQFDLSVTRGNERMLQNVSNDQNQIIIDRIGQSDETALEEGLRKQIVTYPRQIESELRSVSSRIAQVQADDTYSPRAKERAISVLQAKQQSLRWQVEPNPGRPPSTSERAQADVGVIADPRDASKKYQVYYDRSGALREFVPEEEKVQRKLDADMKLATHQAQVKTLYEGGGSGGSGSLSRAKADTMDELDQIRTTLYDEKVERARSQAVETARKAHTGSQPFDPNAVAFDEASVPKPTFDEVYNRALENRRLMIALDAETERMRQDPRLAREGYAGRTPPFWPRQQQPYPDIRPLQQPGMERLPPVDPSAPQAPLPPNAYPTTETGPALTNPNLPPQAPPGSQAYVTDGEVKSVRRSAMDGSGREQTQQAYDQVAFNVPKRSTAKRTAMSAAPGNIAEAMGLDHVVIDYDGQSAVPVLPDKSHVERFATLFPPGTEFVGPDGAKYRLPAKKPNPKK